MPSALILGSGSRKKVELSGVNGHFGSITVIAAQELCQKPNNDVKNDAHYVGMLVVHQYELLLVEVGAKGKTDKASAAEEGHEERGGGGGGGQRRIDDDKTIQWERCSGARAWVWEREGVGAVGIVVFQSFSGTNSACVAGVGVTSNPPKLPQFSR
ncbi:hypothetical protein B0H14DRAFT_2562362 [Mycena olivaceomarginata]|nr:hypothetical protein B0H14DRAFT_2562362 [Mycena olivaceomarginata]